MSSHIVAEIFSELGVVFSILGEIETLLNSELKTHENIFECDLIALRAALKKFGEDIDKICLHIKDRTLVQIRSSMRKHAYEEAHLPHKKSQLISSQTLSPKNCNVSRSVISQTSKSSEITLNMLNATEQETDVEIFSINKLQSSI